LISPTARKIQTGAECSTKRLPLASLPWTWDLLATFLLSPAICPMSLQGADFAYPPVDCSIL
jgi:hypothetical protein